jgi:hypothetical protein
MSSAPAGDGKALTARAEGHAAHRTVIHQGGEEFPARG